jgi:hypothetical protein
LSLTSLWLAAIDRDVVLFGWPVFRFYRLADGSVHRRLFFACFL